MSHDQIPILHLAQAAKANGIKLKDSVPICVIVVGMAGSGKTTFMTALQRSFDNNNPQQQQQQEETDVESRRRRGYCLNLDPATKLVPYAASIDIRDVVDYDVSLFFILSLQVYMDHSI
jgi:GTPase SAR1 family protein